MLRTGRQADPLPSGRELDILTTLWALGEASVEEVQNDLSDRFEYDWSYTATLTVLRRLVGKRWVTRCRDAHRHLYAPVLSREKVRRDLLHRMRHVLFDGSAEAMITMLRRGGDAAPPSELTNL